jgi:transglutaminase-like putative cysteine protease
MKPSSRVACLTLALVLVAAAATARRERLPAHPDDEAAVFAGGEDVERGTTRKPPAVAYWRVVATLEVPAGEQEVHVGLLVPLSDGRQDVLLRRARAGGLRFEEAMAGPNLRAEWTGVPEGGVEIVYDMAVRIAEARASMPAVRVATLPPPPDARAALASTDMVQAKAPAVVARVRAVVGKATRVDEITWALYQYVAAMLTAADATKPQDAASVLAARRGTGIGRARALVALLRAAGVPARLASGLRLEKTPEKRATTTWVEAWNGDGWVPLDPAAGLYGVLPDTYLTLYRGDAPLVVHTRDVDVSYRFAVRPTSRRALEEEGAEEEDAVRAEPGRHGVVPPNESEQVKTHAAYVTEPIASVVLIADQSVQEPVTDRILAECREASIDCVLLTAHFESRYFRESYLGALVAARVGLIRRANLVLVATADDAGAYALMGLGERNVRMPDSRLVVAGAMRRSSALMLGSLLYHLIGPGEVVMVPRAAELLPLWEIARANLIDGTPMPEEAARWGIDTLVVGDVGAQLSPWRRPLMLMWARAVRAQVPLTALTLILILPIIATLVVVARIVIGVETFGMFGPVIVSLAIVTTGLWWGVLIFFAIVGLGVSLRVALQRLRLQAVARLAILIGLVAAVMGGLTLVGATLGIGPLLNISIFPMIIMSNVIENFAASQVEFGTAHAVRLTTTTLLLAIVCYLTVERAGLQSAVLTYPEILVATVGIDVLLGKWRGLRLLEYVRFFRAVDTPAAESSGR